MKIRVISSISIHYPFLMNALHRNIFIIIALLFATCKKVELPPETSNQVVFSVKTDSDLGEINIEAGNEDFVLFPEFTKGADDVYSFIGTFKKDDCITECGEYFRIEIRDFQQTIGGNPDVLNGLKTGIYQYEIPLTDTITVDSTVQSYKLDLDAGMSDLPSPQGNLFEWEIDDSVLIVFQDEPKFEDVDLSGFIPSSPFEIRLTVRSTVFQDCQSTQKQNLQFSNIHLPCRVNLSANVSNSTLKATGYGQQPFLYFWSNGDTSSVIDYDPNTFDYSVTFIDANGCISTNSVNLTNGISNFCAADFEAEFRMEDTTYEVEQVVDAPFEFSKVIIEYTPDGNDIYRTDLGEQNDLTAFFEIISSEEYSGSESPTGVNTKKLEVRFKCKLFNESGDSIQFSNGEGVIGLGIPD